MNLYVFDIGEKKRIASRFISHVRSELQKALSAEKASRKLTQQEIANQIGVNRSVINRQFMGLENLTLRRVAELSWVLGWEIVFFLRKRGTQQISHGVIPVVTAAGDCNKIIVGRPILTGTHTENKVAA